MAGEPEPKKTVPSSGSDDGKLFAVLAYLLGVVGWIIAFVVKKDDPYVRFHLYQSIFFLVAMFVVVIGLTVGQIAVGFIPGIGNMLACLFGLAFLGLWLVAGLAWLFVMWKAWCGEKYKLPVIGDYAEKFAG